MLRMRKHGSAQKMVSYSRAEPNQAVPDSEVSCAAQLGSAGLKFGFELNKNLLGSARRGTAYEMRLSGTTSGISGTTGRTTRTESGTLSVISGTTICLSSNCRVLV